MKEDKKVIQLPTFTSKPLQTNPKFIPFSITITFNTYEEYVTAANGHAHMCARVQEAYSKYN